MIRSFPVLAAALALGCTTGAATVGPGMNSAEQGTTRLANASFVSGGDASGQTLSPDASKLSILYRSASVHAESGAKTPRVAATAIAFSVPVSGGPGVTDLKIDMRGGWTVGGNAGCTFLASVNGVNVISEIRADGTFLFSRMLTISVPGSLDLAISAACTVIGKEPGNFGDLTIDSVDIALLQPDRQRSDTSQP